MTFKLIFVVAVTLLLAMLVCAHVDGMNGPSYWRWPWRAPGGALPVMLLVGASIPFWIAMVRFAPPRGSITLGLSLLVVGTVLTEVAMRVGDTLSYKNVPAVRNDHGQDQSVNPQVASMARVISITTEPGTTGYFLHARQYIASGKTLRAFLHDYAQGMAGYSLHARNKPPGSILYYVPFLRSTASQESAAVWSSLVIAVLAGLSVVGTYWLVREVTQSSPAAFWASAFLAMTPGLCLFMPEFDQIYPGITCCLAVFWMRALMRDRAAYAIAFGALFSLICFVTFNLVVLGVFLGAYTLLFLTSTLFQTPRRRGTVVLRQITLAVVTIIALYGLLWVWSGYNPITTLRTGVSNHAQDMPGTHRYWPNTIPFDLTDFAMGTGWISILLVIYALADRKRWKPGVAGVVGLCLLQPVATAVAGVLQGETARVWLFMFPLLMAPVGLELARWNKAPRLVAMGCLWVLMAVLAQNMVLV